MKCMKKRRKGRFRTLTKGLRLGLGRNLEWEKVFGENNVFRSREKREREIFEMVQNQVEPQNIYRKRNSIDRGGIELLTRTKSG